MVIWPPPRRHSAGRDVGRYRATVITIGVAEALDPDQIAEVHAVARSAEQQFGVPQLNDHALALVRAQALGLAHLLARDETQLVGYGQCELESNSAAVEIAGQAAAVDATLQVAVDRAGPDRTLRVWAHGRHSPVLAAAEARSLRRERVLWQLRRPLVDLPPVQLPDGVTIRAFVTGQDEDTWLAINAAAFATHAEQGRWTIADLAARESEAWFDAAGFLLAERAGRVVGFHWTKVHPDGAGEVYVLGVDPAAQGIRLGPALLAAGLAYLAARGCAEVLLYVDESNEIAMRLYERAGFLRYDLDVQFST